MSVPDPFIFAAEQAADLMRRYPERRSMAAMRGALMQAAHICDVTRKAVEEQNRGRKGGSVSQVGQFAAEQLQRAGDAIEIMFRRIDPNSAPPTDGA